LAVGNKIVEPFLMNRCPRNLERILVKAAAFQVVAVHFSVSEYAAIQRLVRAEPGANVIDELERLVDDIGALHNKLIVLIGPPM
jgi:hypothetical protein